MGLLKPRTTSVILYQGDDLEQLAELRRAVDRAENAPRGPQRGGDEVPGATEREALEAFATEVAERAVEVGLQAIGSTRFASLVATHEPRMVEDGDGMRMHPEDEEFGQLQELVELRPIYVNTATIRAPLVKYREGPTRTIVDPDLSDSDLAEFVDDECTDGDLESLWVTAFMLNRGVVKGAGGDPKGEPRSTTGFLN